MEHSRGSGRRRIRTMPRKISPAMAAVERKSMSMWSSDPAKWQMLPRSEDLVAAGLIARAELLLSRITYGTSREEIRLLAEIERLVEQALKLSDEAIVNSDRKADA